MSTLMTQQGNAVLLRKTAEPLISFCSFRQVPGYPQGQDVDREVEQSRPDSIVGVGSVAGRTQPQVADTVVEAVSETISKATEPVVEAASETIPKATKPVVGGWRIAPGQTETALSREGDRGDGDSFQEPPTSLDIPAKFERLSDQAAELKTNTSTSFSEMGSSAAEKVESVEDALSSKMEAAVNDSFESVVAQLAVNDSFESVVAQLAVNDSFESVVAQLAVNDSFESVVAQLAVNDSFESVVAPAGRDTTLFESDLSRMTLVSATVPVGAQHPLATIHHRQLKQRSDPPTTKAVNDSFESVVAQLAVNDSFESVVAQLVCYLPVDQQPLATDLIAHAPELLAIAGVTGLTIAGAVNQARFGGWAGFLSPEKTQTMINGRKAVLIDIREEEERVANGILGLRFGARFQAVALPLSVSEAILTPRLRAGATSEDLLVLRTVAALVNGLDKKPKSKVIIMDSGNDFEVARAIARILQIEGGVKKAYIMKGGFNGWSEAGLTVLEDSSEYDTDPETVLRDEYKIFSKLTAESWSKWSSLDTAFPFTLGIVLTAASWSKWSSLDTVFPFTLRTILVLLAAINYHYTLQILTVITLDPETYSPKPLADFGVFEETAESWSKWSQSDAAFPFTLGSSMLLLAITNYHYTLQIIGVVGLIYMAYKGDLSNMMDGLGAKSRTMVRMPADFKEMQVEDSDEEEEGGGGGEEEEGSVNKAGDSGEKSEGEEAEMSDEEEEEGEETEMVAVVAEEEGEEAGEAEEQEEEEAVKNVAAAAEKDVDVKKEGAREKVDVVAEKDVDLKKEEAGEKVAVVAEKDVDVKKGSEKKEGVEGAREKVAVVAENNVGVKEGAGEKVTVVAEKNVDLKKEEAGEKGAVVAEKKEGVEGAAEKGVVISPTASGPSITSAAASAGMWGSDSSKRSESEKKSSDGQGEKKDTDGQGERKFSDFMGLKRLSDLMGLTKSTDIMGEKKSIDVQGEKKSTDIQGEKVADIQIDKVINIMGGKKSSDLTSKENKTSDDKLPSAKATSGSTKEGEVRVGEAKEGEAKVGVEKVAVKANN
eukprot:gene25689-11354_t